MSIMNGGVETPSLIRLAIVLIVGVVVLSGLDTSAQQSMTVDSDIILQFISQPADGDTVTIDGRVFEFDNDDNIIAGHSTVLIGVSIPDTVSNFRTAVGGV